MKKHIIHRADSRGHADHVWLDTHHTFSFADYYDPERINFGMMRALNDDVVAPGMGFGTHPHDNMEIITIPLDGDLEHRDSMGNVAAIRKGEVQVMSAGTGITHSEYNKSNDRQVKFLQIWIFPRKRGLTPRYGQATLEVEKMRNRLRRIVSPDPFTRGTWINQDAWMLMGLFDEGYEEQYVLKNKEHGVYVFVLEGEVQVDGESLGKRDGIGITGAEKIGIKASGDAEVLVIEVPMD